MHKLFIILLMSLLSFPLFSQTESDTTLLGLPGDNLDLYAVLDLFQKSKTVEDFEKSLNDKKTGINNLDLNLDEKVDFIKVTTKQKDKDFTFILQVDVAEKETQDVAVILVSKDKNEKVTMQIVGDVDLYGKDYVIEPKPPVTPNPGYTGKDPVTVNVTTPTTVVVESAPIVQYVYSSAYVPYYPPYYYGYYPPYFAAFTVMAIGIYRHNNYYYHGGYHGGYGGTVVVHNTNNFNNYNNSRNRSNTVNQNKASGNYNRNNVSNNRSKSPTTTTKRSSNNQSKGPTTTTKKPSTNQSKGRTTTTNQRSSNQYKGSSTSSSRTNSMGTSRSRSGGSYSGGGSRGGGGGGRRR